MTCETIMYTNATIVLKLCYVKYKYLDKKNPLSSSNSMSVIVKKKVPTESAHPYFGT